MGIEYMHKNGFYHRDLKLTNILINGSGDVKISDFGSTSRSEDGYFSKMAGDERVFPPEGFDLINREVVEITGGPADIWALAVAMVELSTGQYIFSDGAVGTIKRWTKDYFENKLSYLSTIPGIITNHSCLDLITKMLSIEPWIRATVSDACEIHEINYYYNPSDVRSAFRHLHQNNMMIKSGRIELA